jgi:hypothetical protein
MAYPIPGTSPLDGVPGIGYIPGMSNNTTPLRASLPPTHVTVGMLRTALAKLPADTLVVLSADEEGNSFSVMGSMSKDGFAPDRFGRGEIDEAGAAGSLPCVTFWPA